MSKFSYRIHLEPEADGGFTVRVPALPGCITFGETRNIAIAHAREAIEGYIETLADLGKPIPAP